MSYVKGSQPISFDGLGDRVNKVKKKKFIQNASSYRTFLQHPILFPSFLKKDMGRSPGLN